MFWGTRMRLTTVVSLFAVSLAAPFARADLNPGDNFQNPELLTSPPWYTSGLPAWYDGTPEDSLLAPIAPPSLGFAFIGDVFSQVYFVNGVDSSGGLGFAYTFTLDPAYSHDGMESASFSPAQWAGVTIFDTGADGSGSSTAQDTPALPPGGFAAWTDGDPYTIRRDGSTEAPELRWTGELGGTTIEGGQNSSIVWFETDAKAWDRSIVSLLDGGVGGSAYILSPATVIPEPAGTVLVFLGLTTIGFFKRRLA